MRHDTLSDVLSAMKNADRVGKKQAIVPASKLVKEVLMIMQKSEYIGNFELVENGRGNSFKIEMFGKINNCGAVKPRSSAKSDQSEKWERRFLPAAGIGQIIISTSSGMMTFNEAKEKGLGGKVIAFVY